MPLFLRLKISSLFIVAARINEACFIPNFLIIFFFVLFLVFIKKVKSAVKSVLQNFILFFLHRIRNIFREHFERLLYIYICYIQF